MHGRLIVIARHLVLFVTVAASTLALVLLVNILNAQLALCVVHGLVDVVEDILVHLVQSQFLSISSPIDVNILNK